MRNIESGLELRVMRQACRVELKRLAKLLGIDPEALRAIETDKVPVLPEFYQKAQKILAHIQERAS